MSPPLEPGPIYAPGAGPPHPALRRRQVERAHREQATRAAEAAWAPPPVAPLPAPPPPAQPAPVPVPQPVEQQAQPVAQPQPVAEKRRFDWVIGVVLGIVLGLGVAAAFVFIGSEDTVDAPQVRGDVPAKTTGPDPNGRAEPERVPGE